MCKKKLQANPVFVVHFFSFLTEIDFGGTAFGPGESQCFLPQKFMKRKPRQAGFFYPENKEQCLQILQECTRSCAEEKTLPLFIHAGIVPHAGWLYSGPTAGKAYKAIAQKCRPKTFVIFGAVHVYGVSTACIWSKGDWETPLGTIAIDEELAGKILAKNNPLIQDKAEPHLQEHSIEVQVPFIQYLFPDSKLLPILVSSFSEAHKIGEIVHSVVNENEVVVLGSTDLTHYGPRFGFTPKGRGKQALDWVKKENDAGMIDLMLQVEAEKVVKTAEENSNACGAGAIAAVLEYARKVGKSKGVLLEYTTSQDVQPGGDTFVGYSSVVF